MRPPVLVAGPAPAASRLADALRIRFAVTTVGDLAVARAMASTGAHLAVVAVGPFARDLPGALAVDDATPASETVERVERAVAEAMSRDHADEGLADLAALPYDEYSALVRYGVTRRYLVGLLQRHRGSVTCCADIICRASEALGSLLAACAVPIEQERGEDRDVLAPLA